LRAAVAWMPHATLAPRLPVGVGRSALRIERLGRREKICPMAKALQSELIVNVIASILVSLLFLVTGFLWGKYKEQRRKFGRNLEEYDFYPFTVTRENFGEFDLKDFRLGIHYFLKNEDHIAAWQLIFIGETHNLR